MADVLRFVHGDTAPQLKLTISDSVSGTVVDLTDYSVTLYIRAANTTGAPVRTKSSTDGGISKTNPTLGECIVVWNATDLQLAAGTYEGEIELYNAGAGIRETIYDLVSFSVRGEIGPVPLSNFVP